MYGLVNGSLKRMVIDGHGVDVWQQVLSAAKIDDDFYVANESYPDAVTYQLVMAGAEVLGVPVSDLLRQFGVHWILNTAAKSYADLMNAGQTLEEFLLYLPTLHGRVELVYPHLRPPQFACHEREGNRMRVEYRSDREALAPFVVGLLEGLATHFDESVSVAQVAEKGEGQDCDVFEVIWT